MPTINPTKHVDDVLDLTRQYNNLFERRESFGDLKQSTHHPTHPGVSSFTWDFGVLAISSTNGTQTYLQDDLGSPLRLFDNVGAEHEAYGYDEFGVGYNTTSQSSIQPFGFTGYQRDNVTHMHHAQAREYTPLHGRFTSCDIYKESIYIPQATNAYHHCYANPLKWVDRNGFWPEFPSRLIYPYGGGTSTTIDDENDCNVRYPNIYIELTQTEIWQIFQMKNTNNYLEDLSFMHPLLMQPYVVLRDVTNEVQNALNLSIREIEDNRINNLSPRLILANVVGDLLWFYNQVNHSQPWDIKRLTPWENTIGTAFPGRFDTPVYFNGRIITPEDLGNYTYGFLGAALGFSSNTLIMGSWFADGFSLPGGLRGNFTNEFHDWFYVIRGYQSFHAGRNLCD